MGAIVVSAVQTDSFLSGKVLQRAEEHDGVVQICDIQADISDFRVVNPRGIQGDRPVLVSDVQVANLDSFS